MRTVKLLRLKEVVKGRERKPAQIGEDLSHWYRVCTGLYLYQKGARGMESPEMYSFSRCKTPSDLYWPSNYPVSRKVVKSRERKPAQIGEDLSHWYRVCTKAIFISKGS